MRRLSGILVAAVLLSVTAGPALAQADAWQRKWYWGAQSGVFFYSTPTNSTDAAVGIGAHWLITGRRSGLYVALDQFFYPGGSTSQVADGTAPGGFRAVSFESGRRLQANLLAIPSDGTFQFYIGGGIAINQITDATAQGTTNQAIQETVEERATRAFAIGTAGFQLRMGGWAIYGQYQYSPSSKNFLITSEQHALTGGIRVILGSSHEDVTTER